jgi:hypothetical protein
MSVHLLTSLLSGSKPQCPVPIKKGWFTDQSETGGNAGDVASKERSYPGVRRKELDIGLRAKKRILA